MFHHTGWVLINGKNLVDHWVELSFNGKVLGFEGDFADVHAAIENASSRVPMVKAGKLWTLDMPDLLAGHHEAYLASGAELLIVISGTHVIFHNKTLAVVNLHAVPKPQFVPGSNAAAIASLLKESQPQEQKPAGVALLHGGT